MSIPPYEGQEHVSVVRWHNRLSNPCIDTVKRMSTKGTTKGLENAQMDKDSKYDSSVAAKQQKLSHPRSDSRAARTCELIHTDSMCPTEEWSQTGEGQFHVLTMMNDFSRYAEVAVMQQKSDATDVLKNIAARFERKTGNKIQKFASIVGRSIIGSRVGWQSKGLFHSRWQLAH
jgi:hypothetical protein